MYTKNCPRCNVIVKYKRKNALIRSIKLNATCQSCKFHKNIPYESNKKWCKKCKTNKLFNEFNKNKNSKDGLQSNCRLCGQAKNKKYREENYEKEIIRQKNIEKKIQKKLKT